MRPVLAGLLVTALFATGCTTAVEPEIPQVNAPSLPFVVLGGEEADAGPIDDPRPGHWARRVFQELPRRTVHVDLARVGATVGAVREEQVPAAVALAPALVVLWPGRADALVETPAGEFRRDLTAVVSAFAGETDVVLLTMWDDDRPDVPSVRDAPYIRAIRSVAAATTARLVELRDLDADDPGAQMQIAERVLAAARAG